MRRLRENVVKSGHVLNPSEESGLIGYVDNSGRIRLEGCRFAHGAGFKRFLRLQCTSLTRADKVDLALTAYRRGSTVHGSKGVSAHLGTVAERHAPRRKKRES